MKGNNSAQSSGVDACIESSDTLSVLAFCTGAAPPKTSTCFVRTFANSVIQIRGPLYQFIADGSPGEKINAGRLLPTQGVGTN